MHFLACFDHISYTAAQYIELNPVRAGLVEEPW
jgi:hypothetical protein